MSEKSDINLSSTSSNSSDLVGLNKIVILGSLMIDFVSYAPRLPAQGETIKGSQFYRNQGGKGANQCVAAAKLGGNTSMIGKLGSDYFGEEYLGVLESFGVDTKYTRVVHGYASGVAQIMVDSTKGHNCIVIVPGANDTFSETDIDSYTSLFEKAKVLVCQLEIPANITLKALKKFKGISIFNAAPAMENLNRQFFQSASIFCVNETEASLLTHLPCTTIEEGIETIKALKEKGCNTIILTMGEKGALIAKKDSTQISQVLAPTVKAVDSTGAGDAFIGALAYLIAEEDHLTLEKQVEIACTLASYSVQFKGTHKSFADRRRLLPLLDENN